MQMATRFGTSEDRDPIRVRWRRGCLWLKLDNPATEVKEQRLQHASIVLRTHPTTSQISRSVRQMKKRLISWICFRQMGHFHSELFHRPLPRSRQSFL